MPDLGNNSVFSQTDGSNNSGTQPSWSGSAAPSTLDDAGRGLQGAVTREWNWRNYTLTAGGTADAKTLTYSVAPAAYYNGQRFAFIANTTNATTTPTLNVNSLGAITIKKVVSGTLSALAAGDLVAGAFIEVAYNSSNSCFVWVNQGTAYTPPQSLGTTDSPQFAGVNVGNASDTTITRVSAGVIAVEGNTVVSPASPAQGDIIYFDGTSWVRLAAGTSGNYLKTNGAGANPAWASVSSGSATSLGTITTTSGSSQSLGSLTLTGYKFLKFVFNGVSGTSSATISVGSLSIAASFVNTDTVYGTVEVDLSNGVGTSSVSAAGSNTSARSGPTGYSTATTSVTISIGAGTFDAGSVTVYGIS